MHRVYSFLCLSFLLCALPYGALADGPAVASGSTTGTIQGGMAGAPNGMAQPLSGVSFSSSSGTAQPASGQTGSFGTAQGTSGFGYQPVPSPLSGIPAPGTPGFSPSSVPHVTTVGSPSGITSATGTPLNCDPTKGDICPGKTVQGVQGQGILGQSILGQGVQGQGVQGQGLLGQGVQGQGLLGQGIQGQGTALPLLLPEVSSIEKSFTDEQVGYDKSQPQIFALSSFTQFGYSFFRPDATGFSPQTDAPVGPDYQIGVGDSLILTLWGSVEGSFELEVNRSGEIVLPKVGKIKVLGASFGQLPDLIRANLSRVIKDYHLTVNMGKLHLIKVYLVGEVRTPGDYTITSLSTLLNALSAAGGPTKNGSLRNIQIKRGGRLVETVDLYEFFLKGDKSRDIRLQPGDTIFVPVIGPVVGIAGNVRRPAIYELKDEKTLRDVIGLAEGINPSGYLQRVQILRVQAHDKKFVSDFNLDPKVPGKLVDDLTSAIKVQDMDLVKIFPIDSSLRGYVRLTGYLLRTGDYALQPGAHISSILLKEYLLPEYYREAGELTRLCPPDYHPEKVFFNVAKALEGDPKNDLELKEFDTLKIFSRWEKERMPMVRIGGEIEQPGEYRLFDKMTVRDLVIQAGNPKLTAYLKNAEISRIKKSGEKVTSYSISINLEEALKGDPASNIPMLPYDELTIRKIPDWTEETDRYITLAGEFVFPGIYPIYKGERLSSVIERAGGFTDKAFLKATKFFRKSLQDEQQKRMDEMIAKTEQDITKKQSELASVASSPDELTATKASLDGLMRTAERLKTAKAEGRMVIQLDKSDAFKGSTYDVELMGGDTLSVPPTPNSVNVMGQVYNPTAFIVVPGQDVSFYLKKAGGANRDAETDDMYIVRADGSVDSRPSHAGFLFFNGFGSVELDAGDTLIVPPQIERTAWMRDIKDITSILGQIALTAGVLIAAGL